MIIGCIWSRHVLEEVDEVLAIQLTQLTLSGKPLTVIGPASTSYKLLHQFRCPFIHSTGLSSSWDRYMSLADLQTCFATEFQSGHGN